MAWDAIDSNEIEVGDPITAELMTKIKGNMDYLYGQTGAQLGIPNGSFEIDSDADGVADSWSSTAYTGGTVSLDTTTPAHGATAVKMVHPGGASNGGGYYESDYIECSEEVDEIISMIHWATAAGMENKVVLYFHDEDKIYLSYDIIYNSTSNPTTETLLLLGFTPPATARYFKVRLIGGSPDIDVAGTAYFDRIERGGSELIRGLRADFTITEDTRDISTFADVGSASIYIPVLNMPLRLIIPVEIRYNASAGYPIVQCRFRIGSDYSEVAESSVSSYSLRNVTFDVSALSSPSQTIYIQSKVEGHGATNPVAYTRKTTAKTVVTGGAA